MSRTSIALLILLFSSINSFSQIRATTESGNKVLLYENGSWKYEEQNIGTENASLPSAAIVATAAIMVDSTKSESSDSEEIYYGPSPRLVKYFGDAGGKIRCNFSCLNELGTVTLQFIWEFPVSDCNRYFGWFEDSKVTFTMEEGETLELISGEKSDIKRYERNNYSVLTNTSLPLTQEQITILASQPIRKMEVSWRKRPEEYEVSDRLLFVNSLPGIL